MRVWEKIDPFQEERGSWNGRLTSLTRHAALNHARRISRHGEAEALSEDPPSPELTPEEIDEDYEKNTGKVIIETFQNRGIDPVHVPGVLCASHGPFTWGKDAAQAVYHAVVLEEVAKMAILTLTIDPDAQPAPQHVLDKHFMRKHGPNAYYGQK